MITYNYQYSYFKSDQVEEGGAIGKSEAMEVIKHFPFQDNQSVEFNRKEITLPTITFTDDKDQSSLTIWKMNGKFMIECQIGKHSMSELKDISSIDVLAMTVKLFYERNWGAICELYNYKESNLRLYVLFLLFYLILPVLAATLSIHNAMITIADLLIDNPSTTEKLGVQLIVTYLIIAVAIVVFSKTNKNTGRRLTSRSS